MDWDAQYRIWCAAGLLAKRVFGLTFLLLLLTSLILTVEIHPVRATGTIYIRADGSIDSPDAPIQPNGDYCTLTGNITSDADGIVIERNNVIIDGAGYTVQGTGGTYFWGYLGKK
jgi:hypothetical protein